MEITGEDLTSRPKFQLIGHSNTTVLQEKKDRKGQKD
jgi:hypothetical protein